MKVTLEEMNTFIAVVDSGSITTAANQIGATVSATSRTLSRLEEKLQSTLIYRTTRRLKLSEEGDVFLQRAREVLALVEDAEEMMLTRQSNPVGKLRVDASTPFMLHIITPLIERYHQQYPQVQLELTSNEGITDLLQKRTDVALRIGRLKDSTLHATLIGNSAIRLFASPYYLAKYGTPETIDELKNHILLGFTEPDSLNYWPLQDIDGQPLHIKPAISSSSGETLRHLALEGCGIVCLSDFMTQQDCASGKLVQLFSEQTLDIRQPVNAVYYRNSTLSSRIRSFIDFVKDNYRQI